MRISYLFTFVLGFCVLMPVSAQSLWKDSAYDMTPDQIQELFSDAKPPGQPDSVYSGAKELLQIRETEMYGLTFQVSFFFKDDGLKQIIMTASEEASGIDTYTSLSALFNFMYGMGTSNGYSRGTSISQSTNWFSGDTRITLHYSDGEVVEPILNLIYRAQSSF